MGENRIGMDHPTEDHRIAGVVAVHEALRPFAFIDGEGAEDFRDETRVTLQFGRTTNYGSLTLGDLRRATAALSSAEPGEVKVPGTTNNPSPSPITAADRGRR